MPQFPTSHLSTPEAEVLGWKIERITEPSKTAGENSILLQDQAKLRLIDRYFGKETTVTYAPTGKPLPIGNAHISFSHSGDLVVLAVALQPVGIDLQLYTDKLLRVSSKFVAEKEWAWMPEEAKIRQRVIHLLWCAKEAVYKIYGERIAFKDINCDRHIPGEKGQLLFTVENKEHRRVDYCFFDDFCCCVAI